MKKGCHFFQAEAKANDYRFPGASYHLQKKSGIKEMVQEVSPRLHNIQKSFLYGRIFVYSLVEELKAGSTTVLRPAMRKT